MDRKINLGAHLGHRGASLGSNTFRENKVIKNQDLSNLSQLARRVRGLSIEAWGKKHRVELVGTSAPIQELLQRIEKLAPYQEPVLIRGESGTGKELIAQTLYLLGPRLHKPFISVNCPQYQEGNLTVSELFGHRRGSFTGADSDRKGAFESAEGGIVFLDEVGDLAMSAQVMLLRTLAAGEFQPLGSDTVKRANVRILAATNRPLNHLAADERFRRDLLFRLQYFLLEVPPLRERGEDWLLLLEHTLAALERRYGEKKKFSTRSLELLEDYPWPGNVRELIGLTTAGYALAEGEDIEPPDFQNCLQNDSNGRDEDSPIVDILDRLASGRGDFWQLVQQPYLDRDLNRKEVRLLIRNGLDDSRGSYSALLENWRLPRDDYQKFMDFLRHHRLKPS